MDWLKELFFSASTAHSLLVLALVVAVGALLEKIKIGGVSIGATWILFVGIIASHFGLRVNPITLHFIKEFGLILFIFMIGLQVGPGFFSSFKKGGVKLNMLAVIYVFLGCLTAFGIHLITNTPLTTMTGVLCGAVTNTPGLGAAQQTLLDVTGMESPSIAMGYAVAYPLGVLGVIISLVLIKKILKVDVKKERDAADAAMAPSDCAIRITVMITNPVIFGKSIFEADKLLGKPFVISRIHRVDGSVEIASSASILNSGDKISIVSSNSLSEGIAAFFGEKVSLGKAEEQEFINKFVTRKLLITKSSINGKQLGSLNLRATFGINITRVNRAGVDLPATPELLLQLGDSLTVVGEEKAIGKVAKLLGNSMDNLREPHIIPIFLGIFIGVIFGSIPIAIPGMSAPMKIGLAGGPLIIAILIGRFGPKWHMVTYTTTSANKMLREVGISLFLAAVGLGAGEGFVETVVKGGYIWILYGIIITVLPVIIVSVIARVFFKLNYFQILGLVSGCSTNPPALAFSNSIGGEMPSVTYATVYPLTMFLRVLAAEVLILMAV